MSSFYVSRGQVVKYARPKYRDFSGDSRIFWVDQNQYTVWERSGDTYKAVAFFPTRFEACRDRNRRAGL